MTAKFNSILLVDDDAATNFIHQLVIKKTKCAESVVVTENGQEALEYLQSKDREQNEQPNIIFLDINMPIMNGWEFLEEYERLNANTKRDIVIIMLTTSLNPDDLERANQFTTINRYLSKPLTSQMIEEIAEEHFTVTV